MVDLSYIASDFGKSWMYRRIYQHPKALNIPLEFIDMCEGNMHEMDECRINRSTARLALKRLEQRGLIVYKVGGFLGHPTPMIRINWEGFEKRYKEVSS